MLCRPGWPPQGVEALRPSARLLELLRLLGVHLYHDVRTLTRLVRVLACMVHTHRDRPGVEELQLVGASAGLILGFIF